MSRNDIVLLACGSRSMGSVRLPRIARAAARLMAVVVFPTPPFWLAIATITGTGGIVRRDCAELHLVFPEILWIEALQPLVQTVDVLLAVEVRRLRREIKR